MDARPISSSSSTSSLEYENLDSDWPQLVGRKVPGSGMNICYDNEGTFQAYHHTYVVMATPVFPHGERICR